MLLPAPNDPLEVQGLLWDGWGGKLAWDIGANVGQSVPKLLGRFTRVVAFEPGHEAYEELERSFGSDDRVTLSRLAVAARPGTLTLSVRQAPILTGQLVATGMPYYGEDRGPATATWGQEEGTIELPCATMDELMADGVPDFVKIDTEGHEAQILAGGSRLMREAKPGFLIEFHTESRYDECNALLSSHGYVTQTVRHPHYQPGSSMWYQHGWVRAQHPGRAAP